MTVVAKRKKSTSTTYPPHAPVELCELYEAESTRISDHYVTLLGAILGQDRTNPYQYDAMEKVWQVLSRQRMAGPESISWFCDVVYLSSREQMYKINDFEAKGRGVTQRHVQYVAGLKHLLDKERKERPRYFQYLEEHEELRPLAHIDELQECPTIWEDLTQKEKIKRIKSIAEAAAKLHELLEYTPFDRSVFRYISENTAGGILRVFRESPTYLTDIDQGSMTNTQFLESIKSTPRVTNMLFTLRLLVLGNSIRTVETESGKKKHYRWTTPETELLGDGLEKNRRNENLYKYFILQIAGYFQKRFNNYLYGTITTLTNVVFNLHGTDDELSEDVVKGVIRKTNQ